MSEKARREGNVPGINVNCSSFSFLPNDHGAPCGMPLSPVWMTNSMSGTGSGDVIRASSAREGRGRQSSSSTTFTTAERTGDAMVVEKEEDALMSAKVAFVRVPGCSFE